MKQASKLLLASCDSTAREGICSCLNLAAWMARRAGRRYDLLPVVDDLVAEAQLALVKAARRYDPNQGASFRTFAALVIRRALAAVVRARLRDRRQEPVFFTDLAQSGALGKEREMFDPPSPFPLDPGRAAADNELLARLRRTLLPTWFEALNMYHVQDYTLAEIGERLGVSREAVRQLLAKAAARARRCLQQEAPSSSPRRGK